MTEIHPPLTGLEARFEAELASVPGWQPTPEMPRDPPASQASEETETDRAVEQAMISGS